MAAFHVITYGRIWVFTEVLGFKSKTDTVVLSLRELIRRNRIEELKELMGSVSLDVDTASSRRQPRQ